MRVWPVHRRLGAHAGVERLGAVVIPVSGGQTARQAQLIHDFAPDAILLDSMTVRIERHPSLDIEECRAATAVLKHRIKQHIGTTVEVVLEEPGALPRSEGKYKRVYDLR